MGKLPILYRQEHLKMRENSARSQTTSQEFGRVAPDLRASAVQALDMFDEQFHASEPIRAFFRLVLHMVAGNEREAVRDARLAGYKPVHEPGVAYIFFSTAYDRVLDAACRIGVPATAVEELAERNVLSRSEIDALIVPRRTLNHRRAKHEPLNQTESERALRVARLMALAEEVFANPEKARTWLRRETRPLGQRTPLEMMETEHGARAVEDLLHGIAHGIAA
jgi:putative toxin-antitoxin system antitoxin component (TIGR02293 family)